LNFDKKLESWQQDPLIDKAKKYEEVQ